MKKGITCIYKITSPTGRVYIGQTTCLRSRLNHYKNMHCKKQHILYNSIKKYGYENHKAEMLICCETSELNAMERFFQEAYAVMNKKGMNLRLVESHDRSGALSDKAKIAISKANSGSRNGMYGKKITEYAKNLQREKLSGSKNYLSKLVLNTETGIYYDCLTEAAFSANKVKGTLWAAIVKYKVNNTSFVYA